MSQAEKELGYKFRLETRVGKLYIEKYIDLKVKAVYQPYERAKTFDVFNAIGDISKKESIQEMRNSILVGSDNEKESTIKATEKDQTSIDKFGLLQEVLTVDKKNQSQAKNIAKNKLKELNKVQKDISISIFGTDDLRAGRIVKFTNKTFDLSGSFLIKSSNHTYNNLIHRVNLTLGEV